MKKYIFFLKFLFCNYFLLLSQNNKKSLLQNDCIDKIDTLYYLVDSINLRVTFNDKKFYLNHFENGFVTKKNEIKLSFEDSFFFEENNLGCIELKIKQFPYYKFHGISEEYYLNGNLKIRGCYYDGKKYGTWKYFNEKGKILSKEYFGKKNSEP
jgi:antitoxin component YwqK of YwqJK toxin-antitoxin module